METRHLSIRPCTTLALVISALVFTGCSRETASTVQLDPPVRVISASNAGTQNFVTATGLVRAAVETPLSFKTPGIIAEMRVDTGQHVGAGQILASLVSKSRIPGMRLRNSPTSTAAARVSPKETACTQTKRFSLRC